MLKKILIFTSFISANAFALQTEPLRKKIFDLYAHKTGCQPVPYTISDGATALDTNLDSFIKEIVKGIQSGNANKQIELFHPRIKATKAALDDITSSQKLTLGFPFEASVYKIFALNTVDGSPGALYCTADEIKIWPQYGYPLQFGLWIQILGQKELGRVYVTLVPNEGRWWIGAFHYHQWTHKSKDYEKWFYEGQEDLKNGDKELAYLKFDLSMKLLDGKKEFHLPLVEQVKAYQKKVMEKSDFRKSVESVLKDWQVLHTGSILAKNGVGITVRVQKEKEISGSDQKKDCDDMAQTLVNNKAFSKLDTLHCSYVIKGEAKDKEGVLGGIYLSLESFKKADAKEEIKSPTSL